MVAALLFATTFANLDYLERCPSPLVAVSPSQRGTVVAPSGGTITTVAPDGISLRSCAYENHRVIDVKVQIAGAKRVMVSVGQVVAAGAPLSEGGSLTLEGVTPPRFFRDHPYLFDPHLERVLVVVDVEGHQARRYERGARTHTWEVGRGQAEGEKEVRGDLKTPRGLYFVVDRSTGPFVGDFAGYYGGHWVKVNYPNAFDARRGTTHGLITEAQAESIARGWWRRELTAQKTRLGGGIGFHGWIGPWTGDADGYGLSWGCVVLHPDEVAEFYAQLPRGAAVVLE